MHKIIFVGYMGVGKTTIASHLAHHLSVPFFDLDELIIKETELKILQIFEQKGEIWFRKKEHEILTKFIDENNCFILSLGGGAPCYANNHLILQQEGVISFYLKAKVSTLSNRLSNQIEQRPLLKNLGENLPSYIGQHLFERIPFYNFAKYTINVDDKTIEEIIEEIVRQF